MKKTKYRVQNYDMHLPGQIVPVNRMATPLLECGERVGLFPFEYVALEILKLEVLYLVVIYQPNRCRFLNWFMFTNEYWEAEEFGKYTAKAIDYEIERNGLVSE